MYNKAKYWVGKIAGILAVLIGLSFLGGLCWMLGIQGSKVGSGLGLLVLVLNLLLIIVPAVTLVICGMSLMAKPRFCSDNPSKPLWLFTSNKKVIVLIVLCVLILVMNCIKMPIANFSAWFKVKPFNIVRIGEFLEYTRVRVNGRIQKIPVFNTLDIVQTILRWAQVVLCACTAVLAAVFLFLKPVAKTAEKTEDVDVESLENNE